MIVRFLGDEISRLADDQLFVALSYARVAWRNCCHPPCEASAESTMDMFWTLGSEPLKDRCARVVSELVAESAMREALNPGVN